MLCEEEGVRPEREVDLGWTLKREVWGGEIRFGCAGRVQDHLLKPKGNAMPQALALTQEAVRGALSWRKARQLSDPESTPVKGAQPCLPASIAPQSTHSPPCKGLAGRKSAPKCSRWRCFFPFHV